MNLIKSTKRILVSTLIFIYTVTSSISVSAGLFPFGSDKKILPGQYSQREDQIDALNEQAIEMFEQGLFEEAQELWEQAIQLMEPSGEVTEKHPEEQDTAEPEEEEIILSEYEREPGDGEIDELYESAVSLFKKQKYVASKKMFERVEASVPEYKATRNYLTILDHKIKRAQQTLNGDTFKANARTRLEERAEWQRILHESAKELKRKLTEQAAPLYQEALRYYKLRKFKRAKDYFTEIKNIVPEYEDTAKYLARIDDDIRQEEQYLIEKMRKHEALARKKEQEEWQRVLQESKQQLQKKLAEQAEPIYQEALSYYKNRQFESAKGSFQEVEWVLPNYKSTVKYLERIDQDIQEEVQLRQKQRAQELERKNREEDLARKREEERLEELRVTGEKKRLQQFQEEIAAHRKERKDWQKILAESERERRNKLKEQADFVYKEAIQFYKKRQFEQAREDFQEVEHIFPDYKSTKKYLAKIDRDIAEEEKQRLAQQQRISQRKMKEKELVRRRQMEEEHQLRLTEEQDRLREYKEKAFARKKQREEWEIILSQSTQERQKKFEKEAEFIYQEALRFYKAQQWERARNGFLEVEQILPGYKQAEKYLARIDQDIQNKEQQRRVEIGEKVKRRKHEEALDLRREEERQAKLRKIEEKKQMQQRQERVRAVYKYALSLHKKGEYIQAKDKFLEVERILPGYKHTGKYLKRIGKDIVKARERRQQEQQRAFERRVKEQRLAQRQAEERLKLLKEAEEKRRLQKLKEEALARQKEREAWEETVEQIEMKYQKRLGQQVESIYQEALRYYKAGWFEQAKNTFKEVEATAPGYKSTAEYLARVDKDTKKEGQIYQKSAKKILKDQEKKTARPQSRPPKMIARQESGKKTKEYPEKEIEHPQPPQSKMMARQKKKEKLALKRAAKKRFIQRKQGRVQKSDLPPLEKNGDWVVKKAVEERQKALAKETEKKYREALMLHKAKNFVEAKLKFIEVESLSPGYKSTLKHLRRIDKKIAHQQKQPERKRQVLSKEKKGLIKGKDQEKVDSSTNSGLGPERKSNGLRVNPESFDSDALVQDGEPVEPQAQLFMAGSAERVDTREDIIQQALLREERSFQKQGLREISAPDREKKSQFGRQKGEKGQADWEHFVKDRRLELKNQRRVVQREFEKQFKQLYVKAVKLYRYGSYGEARELFLQIEQMKPGYKGAAAYLKKAEARIRKGLQKPKSDVVLRSPKTKTRTDIVAEALDALEQRL